MLAERKIPWGITMPAPVKDIEKLAKPEENHYLIHLGCGDLFRVFELQDELGCIIVACDNDPAVMRDAKVLSQYSEHTEVYLDTNDLTGPDSYLLISGRSAREDGLSQGDESIVLANNFFVNLPDSLTRSKAAALIPYALKTDGWVFVIDHLRKDKEPFGTPETHQEYQRRYQEAVELGRTKGNVWTTCPPRWVHHFSEEEISYLFPTSWYDRRIFKPIPYIGDSGKETNAFYLAAKKIFDVSVPELCCHFDLPMSFFQK